MKLATALIAAGVLSASLPAYAQGVQPNNQIKPGVSPMVGGPTGGAVGMNPGQFGTPPGKMAEGQAQIGGVAPPPLPSPANLMDPRIAGQLSADIYSYMALFQKMADEQRKSARESRDVARESQVAAMQDAADKMKQAAAAAMQQAQVAGAMAIASGAITMGGAAQMQGGAQAVKPGAQGPTKGAIADKGEPLKAPTKALTPQEKQQAINAMAGVQQAFTANMAAADADKKKAEAAQQQALAQVVNAQQAQTQQMMQQMQDVIRDVQQKLQQIQQSQTATMQTIMRN